MDKLKTKKIDATKAYEIGTNKPQCIVHNAKKTPFARFKFQNECLGG